MVGFKPRETIDLLKIGGQKFRYWRYHLDPNPSKPKFTGRDVLAYRIIKFLIDCEGLNVRDLEEIKIKKLFDWCAVISMDQARKTILLINRNTKTLEFLPTSTPIDKYNLNLNSMPLRDIILEHELAYSDFGL